MYSKVKNQITLSFVMAVLLLSCINESNPVTSNEEVDSKLVGEWFAIDSIDTHAPVPPLYFRGLQITNDKNISELGIETNTGKIKVLEYDYYVSLLYANKGILIYEHPAHPIAGTMRDTMNYRIEGNKLFIWNQGYSNVYSKTGLNIPLFNPVYCNLSVQINQQIEENIKVYNQPSGYISKISQSEIELVAIVRGFRINIRVDNFTGIGNYKIPYQKGVLQIIGSDYIISCLSDSSDENSITIDKYDEVNNICTGRFNFTVVDESYSSSDINYNLRDGIFALPIYQ